MKRLQNKIFIPFLLVQSLMAIGNQPAFNVFQVGNSFFPSDFFAVEKIFISPGMGLLYPASGIGTGMYRLYQMPDFGYRYLEMVPVSSRSFLLGIHMGQLGNELYNENQLVVSTAVQVKHNLLIGALLHGYYQTIKGYSSHILYGLSLDMIYLFSDKMYMHIKLHHLILEGATKNQDLNQRFQMDVSYQISNSYSIVLGMYSGIYRSAGMILGIQYQWHNKWTAIVSHDASRHDIRIVSQIKFRSFGLDYGIYLHSELDPTHAFGVVWLW
jgi:hypothetical protein